jgi:hypothetical protein
VQLVDQTEAWDLTWQCARSDRSQSGINRSSSAINVSNYGGAASWSVSITNSVNLSVTLSTAEQIQRLRDMFNISREVSHSFPTFGPVITHCDNGGKFPARVVGH